MSELHIHDKLEQINKKNIDTNTNTNTNIIANQIVENNNNSQTENTRKSREDISIYNFVQNIMFIGLDASFLITIKIPHLIGIIYTILCTLIIGMANTWSYYMISIIYEENKEKKEKNNEYNLWNNICKFQIFGKLLEFILFIILSVYSIGEIIIHQILIYNSLGGIINILGGYNFDLVSQFLLHSFFGEYKYKLIINYFISLFIIFPLCRFYLNIDYKQLNILSIIGVNIILFIVIAIFFQFPFYLLNFLDEEKANIKNIIFNNKEKEISILHFFRFIGIFFFYFSGHNGLIQVIKEVNIENKEQRIKTYKCLFIESNIYNSLIYLFISICGYLSMPNGGVDIITERKVFWSKDIIMTIIRLLLILMSINKIIINLNYLIQKFILYFNKCLNKKKNKPLNEYKKEILLKAIILIITSLFSSLYQNIVFYSTFIGGLITIAAFLIPSLMYKQYDNSKTKNCKFLTRFILAILLCAIGLMSSISEIIAICKGE